MFYLFYGVGLLLALGTPIAAFIFLHNELFMSTWLVFCISFLFMISNFSMLFNCRLYDKRERNSRLFCFLLLPLIVLGILCIDREVYYESYDDSTRTAHLVMYSEGNDEYLYEAEWDRNNHIDRFFQKTTPDLETTGWKRYANHEFVENLQVRPGEVRIMPCTKGEKYSVTVDYDSAKTINLKKGEYYIILVEGKNLYKVELAEEDYKRITDEDKKIVMTESMHPVLSKEKL